MKENRTDSQILNELLKVYPEARSLVDALRADIKLPTGPGQLSLRVPGGDFKAAKTLYLTTIHGNLKAGKQGGAFIKKVEYYPSVVNLNSGYARAPELKNPIDRNKIWTKQDVLAAIHYITEGERDDLLIHIADGETVMNHLGILVDYKLRELGLRF